MHLFKFSLLILILVTTISCKTTSPIIGLWQIDKVSMGEEEMTPIARWTRINQDNSQESGNGWLQHSIGTWEYEKENQQMKMISSNGIKDEFGSFKVLSAEKEHMTWSRSEEGQQVEIKFKRIDKIPQAPANKLLGIWKLKTANENAFASYLYFRWDQMLVSGDTNTKKQYSIYKTHGHKQEVQIVHMEDPIRRAFWNYQFKEGQTLTLEKKENGVDLKLEYERIDYMPQ